MVYSFFNVMKVWKNLNWKNMNLYLVTNLITYVKKVLIASTRNFFTHKILLLSNWKPCYLQFRPMFSAIDHG